MNTRFIQLAKVVNDQMRGYIVDRIGKHLTDRKKLHVSSLLLIGVTYKKDVNDVRESTSVMIFKKFIDMGAEVSLYDPLIPDITIKERHFTSVDLTPEKVGAYDCVIILTDHTGLPYDLIVEHASLVFDTRNSIKMTYPHVVRL